jgi:hypothetical protein
MAGDVRPTTSSGANQPMQKMLCFGFPKRQLRRWGDRSRTCPTKVEALPRLEHESFILRHYSTAVLDDDQALQGRNASRHMRVAVAAIEKTC